jgi:hypothetical protein
MVQCGTSEAAAEVFANAMSQGTEWLTIRSPQDVAWNVTQFTPDTGARIREDSDAGYTMVAPKKAIVKEGRMGEAWWRIDPKTGETLGMGKHGWGNATEQSHVIAVIALAYLGCIFAGFCIGEGQHEGNYHKVKACIIGGFACIGAAVAAVIPGGMMAAVMLEGVCASALHLSD